MKIVHSCKKSIVVGVLTYTRNLLVVGVAYIHKEPPPVVGRTHIYELLQLETVCILVILLGFTSNFTLEETTHDSSSSSRKSEEKCPPAGGIKMKIGGFKTGHCYHKPSDDTRIHSLFQLTRMNL